MVAQTLAPEAGREMGRDRGFCADARREGEVLGERRPGVGWGWRSQKPVGSAGAVAAT